MSGITFHDRVILLGLMLLSLSCFGQTANTSKKCEKILNQKVLVGWGVPDKGLIQDQLKSLKSCGLKKIEIDLFSNPPIFNSILLSTDGKEELTFGKILEFIESIKLEEEYVSGLQAYKESKKIINALEKQEATDKTLEKNQDKIIELYKLSDSEFLELKKFKQELIVDSKPNILELVSIFFVDREKKKEEALVRSRAEVISNPSVCSIPNSDSSIVEINSVLVYKNNLELATQCANELNKPLLIYFTAYTGVNCVKMQYEFENDLETLQLLNESYMIVYLYCDDQTILTKEEQYISSITGKTIERIGAKNAEYEMEKYDRDIQPFFAVVNNKNETISTSSYSKIEAFKTFLIESKEMFLESK